MADFYYKGCRVAPNTELAALIEEWKKADPNAKIEVEKGKFVNAKAHAKEKLDKHSSALDAEFRKYFPHGLPEIDRPWLNKEK